MDLLPLQPDDLHQVLSLLASLGASSEPVAVRKRQLAEGLARFVQADVWVWGRGKGDVVLIPPADGSLFGGGWKDGRQKELLLRALSHRGWRELCRRAIVNGVCHEDVASSAPERPPTRSHDRPPSPNLTRARRDLICDEDWQASAYCIDAHAPAGVDDFLLSAYLLDGDGWSTLAFWRRRGAAEPFSSRDRHLVQLVTSEIDGIHRLASEFLGNDQDQVKLPPRQHQVLRLLLDGEGNKAIARRLKISENTVAQYVKALHATFKVNSRGELLVRFLGRYAKNGPQ
jgi:DNA-binding CsgD family transcriptional regulator